MDEWARRGISGLVAASGGGAGDGYGATDGVLLELRGVHSLMETLLEGRSRHGEKVLSARCSTGGLGWRRKGKGIRRVPLLNMDKEGPGSLLGEVVDPDELVGWERILPLSGLEFHHVAIIEAHLGLGKHGFLFISQREETKISLDPTPKIREILASSPSELLIKGSPTRSKRETKGGRPRLLLRDERTRQGRRDPQDLLVRDGFAPLRDLLGDWNWKMEGKEGRRVKD